MGCFSFLCKESGKPALSTSFNGSPCYLFLLKNGKVIEEMYGNYDSYGRVFKNTKNTSVPHDLHESFEWKTPWNEVCNLMFYGDDSCGIAMILAKHYKGVHPYYKSEHDPDQGWGSEDDPDYMMDTSDGPWKRVENPYHKVYTE